MNRSETKSKRAPTIPEFLWVVHCSRTLYASARAADYVIVVDVSGSMADAVGKKDRRVRVAVVQEALSATLHGRSKRGTLYATHGYNHRTESAIKLAGSYSWVGLVLTLFVILALVIRFYAPTAKVAQAIGSMGGVQ